MECENNIMRHTFIKMGELSINKLMKCEKIYSRTLMICGNIQLKAVSRFNLKEEKRMW